jgi:hypothetical protein
MSEKDYGPLWQLEQQIKHYDGLAASLRADSSRALVRAAEADNMAQRYKIAHDKLKETLG